MSIQTIPCRARDPRTCPYHGAEIKAKEAVERGDFDAAFKYLQQRDNAKETEPEVRDFIEESAREQYSPTRYPYTYAADYLRLNPDLVPVEIGEQFSLEAKRQLNGEMAYIDIPSRSLASQIRTAWAESLGVTDQELAFQHARQYMQDHDITPAETEQQAIARMEAEIAERRTQIDIRKAHNTTVDRINAWRNGGDYWVAGQTDLGSYNQAAYQQAATVLLELHRQRIEPNPDGTPNLVASYGVVNRTISGIADESAADYIEQEDIDFTYDAYNNARDAINLATKFNAPPAPNGDTDGEIDITQALKNLDEYYYRKA